MLIFPFIDLSLKFTLDISIILGPFFTDNFADKRPVVVCGNPVRQFNV